MQRQEFLKKNQAEEFKLTLRKEGENNNFSNKRNSRSPPQINNIIYNQQNRKSKMINVNKKKGRSPSPQFKYTTEFISDKNKQYKITKKEKNINVIPGNEVDVRKLKNCEKETLPKEKTYIITENNFQKVMDLIKGRYINDKEIAKISNEYEKTIENNNKTINELNQTNESIIKRNKDLIDEIKNKKKDYDKLVIEINKYESTFNKLIALLLYILQLYPNDNNINEKIKELKLDSLLNYYNQNKIKVSDFITEKENEMNEKLIEKENQLTDIEDMKNIINQFQENLSNDLINQFTETKRISELSSKYEKLESEYTYIKAKYNNLIAENNELLSFQKKENAKLQTQVNNLTEEKFNLVNENNDLKNQINNLDINNVETIISNNNKQIEELNLKIQEQEKSINEYKSQIKSLQSQIEKINQEEIQLEYSNKKKIENDSINNSDNNNSYNSINNYEKENTQIPLQNDNLYNYINQNINQEDNN